MARSSLSVGLHVTSRDTSRSVPKYFPGLGRAHLPECLTDREHAIAEEMRCAYSEKDTFPLRLVHSVTVPMSCYTQLFSSAHTIANAHQKIVALVSCSNLDNVLYTTIVDVYVLVDHDRTASKAARRPMTKNVAQTFTGLRAYCFKYS